MNKKVVIILLIISLVMIIIGLTIGTGSGYNIYYEKYSN